MKIAMTGASGNMGREALKQVLELKDTEFVRILLTNKKKNDKLSRQLEKQYGKRIDIIRGTVADKENCRKLVDGVDYVIHIAAVIPPASDADPAASEECNKRGAIELIDAVKARKPQPKYIHISTMALYGNRNEKHPFGRVGDPLLVSPFDVYALHKLYGERYCLDAGLDCFAILRQTAMLHPNMMKDNISDGLMFHTVLNAPLEWVTARDSGYLIKRILERDSLGEIPGFWKKIYNIAAGVKGMNTGYDTFNEGFALIGGSAEKFFQPNWFATRNFHGVWFADGNELEEMFHYQRDGVVEYWKEIGKQHKIYAMGKLVPRKLIHLFLFRKLLEHPNSAYQWVKSGDTARINAYFGSREAAENMSSDWKDYKLIAKGDFGDLIKFKDVSTARKEGLLPSLGYDESKTIDEWTVDDLKDAAAFRGGKLVSTSINGPYEKVTWKCHEGHVFEASPYTVLKGGHWCPECCMPTPWDFDRIAKYSPFVAQIWYDSHDQQENMTYDYDKDGNAVSVKFDPESKV